MSPFLSNISYKYFLMNVHESITQSEKQKITNHLQPLSALPPFQLTAFSTEVDTILNILLIIILLFHFIILSPTHVCLNNI